MFDEIFEETIAHFEGESLPIVDKSTIINRMLHGYRKAFTRWNGESLHAYEVFMKAQKAFKNAPGLDYEGQLFTYNV